MKHMLTCVICYNEWYLTLTPEEEATLNATNQLIKDVITQLTPDIKSVLTSGICTACWEKVIHDLKKEA